MSAVYRLTSAAVWALLCACIAVAQTGTATQPAPASPPELNISLGARQIKFTPLRQYQELRLEIFNNSGELLYASGAVAEAALDYDLRDSNGQPLAPGLYAYTLTVKVADAETPRQHQGHFIIEKGQDQIWLTSKDADNMGAAVTGGALTVSRSPERTTAGYLASGRTLGERAGLRRDLPGRTIVDEPVETPRRLTPNISGSGTTNRITKWLDGPNGVVGDSIISEVGGNIGIGNTTPNLPLSLAKGGLGGLSAPYTAYSGVGLRTNTASDPPLAEVFQATTSPTFTQMSIYAPGGTINSGDFQYYALNASYPGVGLVVPSSVFMWSRSSFTNGLRIGAEAGPVIFFNGSYLPSNERMRIDVGGNVGIGTATPASLLHLQSTANGSVPTQLILDNAGTSSGAALSFRGASSVEMAKIDGLYYGASDGRLRFYTWNGSVTEKMTVTGSGNVGIGTTTPGAKLELNAGVANTSGLRFTQLTSASPVGSATAYLAVDPLGNVVRGATPGGGGGGAPAGSTGQVQFNSGGALGADANLFWDNTNKRLGIGIDPPTARLHVSTASGHAVQGVSTMGYGVFGQANGGGSGVFGANTNPAGGGFAGQFSGHVQVSNNLHVGGNLTKGMGSFKIDHPLDPANKYLYHSFVESPDMKNIYDGNVTTDNLGFAVVTLPDYFAALNRDFRYQLTVIGTFAQAIIAEKIKGNQFTIRTSLPNVEVSWLVTGIRQDAYAEAHRIRVEEDKPEQERGSYLHPELYGQPEEKSLEWARNPELMRQLKQQREKAEKEKKQN